MTFAEAAGRSMGYVLTLRRDAALAFPELTRVQGVKLMRAGIKSRDAALALGPATLKQRIKGFGLLTAYRVCDRLQQTKDLEQAHDALVRTYFASTAS